MSEATPPVAKRVPTTRTQHGDTVTDEYAWLANVEDPDTLAYLRAENAYAEQLTAGLTDLTERILTEIRDRTQETDVSVPARKGGWWYYSRTVAGQQYPIHCRAAGTDEPPSATTGEPLPGEQILLDENQLAEGHDFLSVGGFDVSPDGRLLAYSTDFSGGERFTLRVKDLTTGEVLGDEIPNTFYNTAWSLDSSALFYLTVDDAWRPYRVWRHRLGTPAADDVLVYEEPDERFRAGIGLTRGERYILITLRSMVTSETRIIDALAPAAEPVVLRARRQGVQYSVDHHVAGDRFLIVHNDPDLGGGPNFAIAAAPAGTPQDWTPLVDHRDDTRLLGVEVFAGHVVVHLRHDGLTGLRVYPVDETGELGTPRAIEFPEPLYTIGPEPAPGGRPHLHGANLEYRTRTYRLSYGSLVTPNTVYDLDLATGELTMRKRHPVLGYDPDRYEQTREWATAEDGTRVPLSIVHRAGVPRDGSAPCVLVGYGCYEMSLDPRLEVARLSLLDRGIVFAIAHVRGGGELGRQWYEDGKLLKKMNTFTDFVACARHLVERDWTRADRLVANGSSGGGLLAGAVANLAPEAFTGVVVTVPFVDALNTILDPSLPLTVVEWEEWGDPLHDPEFYAYMKSYSPYENVRAVDYPAIYVETRLNDTRVLYHEPAKWVARLRANGTGDRPIVFRVAMGAAGHGGVSGRYDAWRERALRYAWIVDTVGAPHEPPD